jgi:hypothetical protein
VFVVHRDGGTAPLPRLAEPVTPEATRHAASVSGEGGAAPAAATPGAGTEVAAATRRSGAAHAPPRGEPSPAAERPEEPAAIAGAVLGVLADFLGPALARSRARGTVLSDHGPAIIAVWDEYRRRAGPDAPSAVFRAALRDRCGVDLSRVNGG